MSLNGIDEIEEDSQGIEVQTPTYSSTNDVVSNEEVSKHETTKEEIPLIFENISIT